jgi:hypothetical protein
MTTEETLLESLIGLEQYAAIQVARRSGYTTRIGSVNGNHNALNMAFEPQRITFDVDFGLVTGARFG